MNSDQPDDHIPCHQYSNESAVMEIIHLAKNEELSFHFDCSVMCFVFTGAIEITLKNVNYRRINKEETLLIPLHTPFRIRVLEPSPLLRIKLVMNANLCDRITFDNLLEENEEIKENPDIGVLLPHQNITCFCNSLKKYMESSFNCAAFFEAQIFALLCLIRCSCNSKSVSDFFLPIVSNDIIFSKKIYENIEYVKNTKELAKALCYSSSGFEKRFKKVFKTSPYAWLLEQKSKKIYHEICHTMKTFSELSYEYDFSSPAHFNNFCRKHFGNTPGKLRNSFQNRYYGSKT